MHVLITGGAGYVGSVLAPRLLNAGYMVTVYDALWFGCHLPNHPNLTVVEGDIRDISRLKSALKSHDAVIHTACVANDPSVELDAAMTKEINLDSFEPIVRAAKNAGVRRFIYCSTSSVYGTSDAEKVTEEHPLVPITLYNKYKGECEPLLFKHMADDFTCTILRPATVCGYSPRQRLDLCVNILTNHAINKGKVTVFGGDQMRPNIHIEDLVDVYQVLLEAPHEKIHGQVFNVQCEYRSLRDLAMMVAGIVRPCPMVEFTRSSDPRSYRIDASKIRRVLGYAPRRTIVDAVEDLARAFRNHLLPNSLDDPNYFNVERMKQMGVGTTPRHDPGYVTPAGVVI